jgi:hypothetical protein
MNERTALIFNRAYERVHALLADESTEPRRDGLEPVVPYAPAAPVSLEDFMGDRDLRTMQPAVAAE